MRELIKLFQLPGSLIMLLILGQIMIFNLHSCGFDIEDPTPPPSPQWKQKSLPEAWPETGIDAHETGGIYLEWEANLLDYEIKKYHLYRADFNEITELTANYELLITLDVESLGLNEFIDRSVDENAIYSYKICSEDASNNVSSFSDSVHYILLQSISISAMAPNGNIFEGVVDIEFQWEYNHDIPMENYTITILDGQGNLFTRSEFSPGNYIGEVEHWRVQDSIQFVPDVYSWRIDMGSRYVEGYETGGSESPWATFQCIQ